MHISKPDAYKAFQKLYDLGVLDKVTTEDNVAYFNIRYKLNENHYLLPELSALITKYMSYEYLLSGYFPDSKLVVMGGRFIGQDTRWDLLVVSKDEDKAWGDVKLMRNMVHFSPKVSVQSPETFLFNWLSYTESLADMLKKGLMLKNKYDFLADKGYKRHLLYGSIPVDSKSLREAYRLRKALRNEVIEERKNGTQWDDLVRKLKNINIDG